MESRAIRLRLRRPAAQVPLLLVSVAAAAGCRTETPRPKPDIEPASVQLSSAQIKACTQAEDDGPPAVERYWPDGTFGKGEIMNRWYSELLCAMGEPPLAKPDAGARRMRFLLARSFHPGVAVRVERYADGTGRIVGIELDAAEGASVPGAVKRRVERSLTLKDWASLQKMLADVDVWKMPTREELDFLILDGSSWVIEMATHDRYHVVERRHDGPLGPLGRKLLALSELDPKPLY